MQRHRIPKTVTMIHAGLLLSALCLPHTGSLFAQAAHPSGQGASVCRGFVVLPNGLAVLSGMPAVPERGEAHAHPGHSHAPGAIASQAAGAPAHLMDYQHGQDIAPRANMLCVPVVGQESVSWTGVSSEHTLTVTAESLKGVLTHNSRANEAFRLTVNLDGKPVDQAQVRLLVRMPHHDRRLPGGHGPANDPDVQGIAAPADGTGHYAVPNVDFTMAGPWLMEIQVQEGSVTHKAYVGVAVAEE